MTQTELPLYNTALGASEQTLVVAPPFTFPGVTARVFPLRASLNILTAFCRNYLNVAPEVCEFRPYLPHVLMVVLDYGRMAIEELNMGWVSQHEVFFAVPLGMWRRDANRRRVFDKWVVNTPFIVVDNATSLTTGRETYGWPKVLAKMQDSPERWLTDPQNPVRYLTLDVLGPDSDRTGSRLIEIEQSTGQNISLAPPDLRLVDPFATLSRLGRHAGRFSSGLAQLLVGAPLSGFDQEQTADRREVFFDSLRQLAGFYGRPGLDVVTLKQFRDACDPNMICYQSIVESRLSVARFNRGGLLGFYNYLQADPTGGYHIRLFDNPAFPIVESLGLEVSHVRTSLGRTYSVLEPSFPFWVSVDLNYGKGRTLCWRSQRGPWYQGSTPVRNSPLRKGIRYNTVAGGSEQVWRGPFVIPNASFDIYPLKADSARLGRFISRYLNSEKKLNVKLVSENGISLVNMIVSSSRIFSEARSGAWIESKQVAFYVPIEWKLAATPDLQYEYALATPFAFVDNPALALTMREVEGISAIHACITPHARFFEPKGTLLTMDVDVFPALGAGLPSRSRTVLEIVSLDSATLAPPSYPPLPSARLMLKQFRDAEDPSRACYKALIRESWSIMPDGENPEPENLTGNRQVRLYRYPSLPLVETLGLKTTGIIPPATPEGTIADVLDIGIPFRLTMSLRIGLGTEIFSIPNP